MASNPFRMLITRMLKPSYQPNLHQQRFKTNLKLYATSLIYNDYGDPSKVLHKQVDNIEAKKMDSKEVLVKMILAPVNPADINTIQGKYAVRPNLPSVPGNEGCAEVVAIGEEVTDFDVGDRVVPLQNALGTWRTHAIFPSDALYKIPNKLDPVHASMLTVNPCTAYRMLKDYENLDEDTTVIQNGANSAVGQYVIQLCKAWGIKTVNIVRDRPDIDSLKVYLKTLGATEVLTEEELRTTNIFKENQMYKPLLALNCVGGKSTTELIRNLQIGGTIVTYGGMSMQPVIVNTAALIFKDVNVVGFWMTRWSNENKDSPERMEMLDELTGMMMNNELILPAHSLVPFDEYHEVIGKILGGEGKVGKKFILDFQKCEG